MGNCAATRLAGGTEEDPVAVCRDRKRLIKAAGDSRFALASAHASYAASLRAVAAALDIFVARHTSPAPILITLPSPSPPSSPKRPHLLPSSSDHPPPSNSPSPAKNKEKKQEPEQQQEEEVVNDYYFPPTPPPAIPVGGAGGIAGWDFFNPFYVAEEAAVLAGELGKITDEDLRVVREREGIPDLEEAEEELEVEKKMVGLDLGVGEKEEEEKVEQEKAGMEVAAAANGRELLEALKDIEELFDRAFEAGKEVSRMLEANRIVVQSGLGELKGGIFSLSGCLTSLFLFLFFVFCFFWEGS